MLSCVLPQIDEDRNSGSFTETGPALVDAMRSAFIMSRKFPIDAKDRMKPDDVVTLRSIFHDTFELLDAVIDTEPGAVCSLAPMCSFVSCLGRVFAAHQS